MTLNIKAWMQDGKSYLEILDTRSGEVQLRWSHDPADGSERGSSATQQLFRDLLLLSCKQDLCNGRLFAVGLKKA